MTTIEVRMSTDKYITLEFQKRFEDITASNVMERANCCIWGWRDVTEHIVLGHNINDIWDEDDVPEQEASA